jgi:8-oxo-dGTP pyrophosphatase MutT (NUDIX family)/phosphohistidine phosphatase SixA
MAAKCLRSIRGGGVADGTVIEAAGGVVWRPADRGVELAVVHRPKYDDWSLPKGKLLSGEPPLLGALREVKEETGSEARLGRPLGKLRYRVNGSAKRVRYWAMVATSEEFRPSSEVDAVEWLPPRAARRRLRPGQDVQVLDWFMVDPRPTWPLIVLRHANAGSSSSWAGEDEDRPLDDIGAAQARGLEPILAGYQAECVWSADVTRCRQTTEPYASSHNLPVNDQPLISEVGYRADARSAHRWLLDVAAHGRSAVVCSQRRAIPGLVKALCSHLEARAPAVVSIDKAGAWVFHLARGADALPDLVGMEQLTP